MSGGEHFCTALGFVARTILPLTGNPVPTLPRSSDRAVIKTLAVDMRAVLNDPRPVDFAGADVRTISHIAGEAELTQSGAEYALLYTLPNAYFHLTMGYATLRMTGVLVSKADLDGVHQYAPDTRFTVDV